jgi:diaminohydroxyphosphoribosylaminopyrimidine deaminase/5-amino-6-(5-phosphoribosylamino)uracil reductase
METAARNIHVAEIPEQRAADERFMRRALELAAQGTGLVSPSPLVGCVIVSAEGDVVGEGFYVYDQIKHAEVLALEQAGEAARGGTAYVSLEPHAYDSRTPPCTDALFNGGIARVVYPIDDPNPLIAGRGGEALRASGIEVTSGVLAAEAARLNDVYLHFLRTGRPLVHLKMACSLDGRIATERGTAQWLTGDAARHRAHELRHQYDAILVGVNTAATDDPSLTDRSGMPRRRPLVRVVLDHSLRTPAGSRLVESAAEAPVLIFVGADTNVDEWLGISPGVELVRSSASRIDPQLVLTTLAQRGLQSVLIEGGPTVAAAFLEAGLVDKVTFLIAPILIGGGDAPSVIAGKGVTNLADAPRLHGVEVRQLGADIEVTGYVRPVE